MAGLLIILTTVAVMVLIRPWLLHRINPPPVREPFDGSLYRIGSAWVAERHVSAPKATVICMHGFCESPRYFTRHYRDPDIQLILLTSGDYHLTLAGAEERSAVWASAPPAPVGSIEYDAAILVQALEHLPEAGHIRVHGHSRGGAVVLEAAAMRPELFQGVEVVLEAPVLPQGRLRPPVPAVLLWLIPFLLPLWQWMPIPPLGSARWGALDDPYKRELIATLPFNGRRAVTLLANIHSIVSWMQERDLDIYRNLDQAAVVLVPSDDRVLDADAMRRSASGHVRVVEVEAGHFVLLDRPAAVPPLSEKPAAAAVGVLREGEE